MSVSSELMYAILAMDAYNRGYNPGIAGLGGMGSQIGTATVGIDADDPEGVAQAAGFYGLAYQWNGETIIAYRGSDSYSDYVGVDLALAINDDYDEAQVQLASKFYQAVATSPGTSPTIKLTGHSLGGALAGFVGGVYDKETVGFDSIGFYPALQDFQALIDQYLLIKGTPAEFTDMTLPPSSTSPSDLRLTVQYVEELLAAMGIPLTALPPLSAHSGGTYSGWHASGEIADTVRFSSTPSTAILGQWLPDIGGVVDPFDAHRISLTVILEYVKQQFAATTVEALKFEHIIDPLLNALLDNGVAQKAGYLLLDGLSSDSTKMRDAIAYSSLEKDAEGNGTLVFGDTGIRALFDDANAVGKLVNESKAPTGYTVGIRRWTPQGRGASNK
jgi:hypothetical protein